MNGSDAALGEVGVQACSLTEGLQKKLDSIALVLCGEPCGTGQSDVRLPSYQEQ
jgi:hypothetical protein